MSRLAEELAQLEKLTPTLVREQWKTLFRRDVPPHSIHLLRRQIASKLQEREQGGLSRSTVRQLERIDQGKADCAAKRALAVGTRLVRDWNGRRIEVLVLEEGYRFEGRHFRSLSQIARHVTGAHWSGPRFFGLNDPRPS